MAEVLLVLRGKCHTRHLHIYANDVLYLHSFTRYVTGLYVIFLRKLADYFSQFEFVHVSLGGELCNMNGSNHLIRSP